MKDIKDSVVATHGSTISKVKYVKNSLGKEKKKSFWEGFGVGILSSLVASLIWYLITIFIS